jgi:hypothetical protein
MGGYKAFTENEPSHQHRPIEPLVWTKEMKKR